MHFMMMVSTLIASLGISVGSPTDPSPPKKGSDDEIICKNRAKTGTRFATKVCMTRKAREEAAERDRRVIADEYQGGAKSNPPERPGGT